MTLPSCISLETGGLIIGVLEIIAGTIGTIVGGMHLRVWADVEKEFDKQPGLLQHLLYYCRELLTEDNYAHGHLAVHIVHILVNAFVISSVLQIILSFVLIYGIVKASSGLMIGWAIFKTACLLNLTIILTSTFFLGTTFQHALIYVPLIGHCLLYLVVIYYLKKKIQRLPANITSQNKF